MRLQTGCKSRRCPAHCADFWYVILGVVRHMTRWPRRIEQWSGNLALSLSASRETGVQPYGLGPTLIAGAVHAPELLHVRLKNGACPRREVAFNEPHSTSEGVRRAPWFNNISLLVHSLFPRSLSFWHIPVYE